MKLVKLCYVAHGWHLALTSKPLLDENPEAWRYGPVIPTVYHSSKHFGNNLIFEPILSTNTRLGVISPKLSEYAEEMLKFIWVKYGDLSGIDLSNMTHKPGTPWDIVWKNNPHQRNQQIPDNLTLNHYKKILERYNKAQQYDSN